MFYDLQVKLGDKEVSRVIASEVVILRLIEFLPRYYAADISVYIAPTKITL